MCVDADSWPFSILVWPTICTIYFALCTLYIYVPYIFPTLNTGLLHLSHILGLIPLVSRIRCDNCPH